MDVSRWTFDNFFYQSTFMPHVYSGGRERSLLSTACHLFFLNYLWTITTPLCSCSAIHSSLLFLLFLMPLVRPYAWSFIFWGGAYFLIMFLKKISISIVYKCSWKFVFSLKLPYCLYVMSFVFSVSPSTQVSSSFTKRFPSIYSCIRD